MEPKRFEWPVLGITEPVCPHCQHRFPAFLTRTKKCVACKEKIWVRTRPSDCQRVLVTEQEAKEIDEQWTDQSTGISRKSQENDRLWASLNKRFLEAGKARAWGQLRFVRLEQADVLRREGKDKRALNLYLECFFLDVNGVQDDEVELKAFLESSTAEMKQMLMDIDSNSGDREYLAEVRRSIAEDLEKGFESVEPPFKVNATEISPVLCSISEICVRNRWKPADAWPLFEDAASRWTSWQLPVSAEDAWSILLQQMEIDNRAWG